MANTIQSPIIGINLLNMLMLQLYNNPRCIFREYIQNSLDSINEAVRIGILQQVKDGRVSITIGKNDITIEDNGTGIEQNKAGKLLTDIANSVKNGIDTAGQFGVGRLSGGGYCKILEFETTYIGEDVATIVSIDTVRLRKLIEKKQTDISAEEAMSLICTIKQVPSDLDKHGFVVRLKQVFNSREILLDVDEIKEYVMEYAPIDYSVTFNSLINTSSQTDFVRRHKAVERIRVSLNEYTDIEKAYEITVLGSGDKISKIRYFELPEHPKYGKLGWGWYAVTEFSVQINEEKDNCVGIRLRKHNISLEKNILNSCFKETRGNKYFYGEIFITNDNIVPDSGRQGLAASEEADALINAIKQYFTSVLKPLYYRANKLKSSLNKIGDIVEKLDDPSFRDARGPLLDKLKEYVEEFNKATITDGSEEIDDVVSLYKKKYVELYKATVDSSLYSKIDTKQFLNDKSEAPINRGFENDKSPFNDIIPTGIPHKSNSKRLNDETRIGGGGDKNIRPTVTQQLVSGNVSKSKLDEMLASLKDKQYSDEQIDLLRRVLNTMLVVCSSSQKKNIMLLIDAAIHSL